MSDFKQKVQIRWADLDPNFHLRHSVYYDWGAFCRVAFLTQYGLTTELMQQLRIGPIIFREEAIFRKEIRSGDEVEIDLVLTKSKKDYSRWSIRHQVFKNEGQLCTLINIDGAWLNTKERKLATPPAEAVEVFSKMPQSPGFEWQG